MILFVSGTGTGVGKTTVACSLAAELRRRGVRVGVAKPVATGAARDRRGNKISRDAILLMKSAGRPPAEYPGVNPILFDPPISPHLAARLARRPIRLGNIRTHLYNMEKRFEILLVEGIGGAATPLTARATWTDFMADFRRPRTILVGSPNLGTLNHTLMSLEYLSSRGVACSVIVLSNYDPTRLMHRQNFSELKNLTGLPVWTCRKDRALPGDLIDLCR